MKKRAALGKGLASLIPGSYQESAGEQDQIVNIDVTNITPCPFQPRKHFDEDGLTELAQSIRSRGILQPILVRPVGNNRFEIIAGERRWRASQIAELKVIPALVKNLNNNDVFEIALIENLQRKDLSAIEEAEGYKKLLDDFRYTQEDLSEIIGKNRSTIANKLRLLTLPETIKTLLKQKKISEGHARSLIGKDDAEALAQKIVKNRLNVRQAENISKPKPMAQGATEIQEIEESLQNIIGHPVRVRVQNGRGNLKIEFDSLEKLDTILNTLSKAFS